MKRNLALLAAAVLLMAALTACGGNENENETPSGSLPQSSSQSQSGESNPQADHSDLTFTSEELGISFDLPELLRGHSKVLTEEETLYGETVHTVACYYMKAPGQPETDVSVFRIALMSKGSWEKMQAEGGPLGSLLGESQDGRVAVITTLQSNPFAETDEEYALFNQLPSQLSGVYDSFRFLDEAAAD